MSLSPTPQKILIRSPNWIGDVVMATPSFRAMREAYPNAHLALLIKKYARPVIDDSPWFDEVIEYDPSSRHRGASGHLRLLSELRSRRFDTFLVLVNSMRGALEAYFSGAKNRIGYARNWRRALFTHALAPPVSDDGRFAPQNMVEYYLRLCSEAGCRDLSLREELFVREEIDRRAEEFLLKHGRDISKPLIGLNPGAAFGSSKCWIPERFGEVADACIERFGCDVFICSAPSEREVARAVEASMKHRPINPYDDNPGLDVYKGIIKRMSLLVTNDTGARHIAVAFGVPVVVIFGSTDLRYTKVNIEHTRIVSANVDCAPCQQRICPTGTHDCMKAVTAEMVTKAIAAELAEK